MIPSQREEGTQYNFLGPGLEVAVLVLEQELGQSLYLGAADKAPTCMED